MHKLDLKHQIMTHKYAQLIYTFNLKAPQRFAVRQRSDLHLESCLPSYRKLIMGEQQCSAASQLKLAERLPDSPASGLMLAAE